jgi:hypothetical protein
MFESCRAHHLTSFFSIDCRQFGGGCRSCVFRIVPRIVSTLDLARLFHRVKERLPLRVNVALRGVTAVEVR